MFKLNLKIAIRNLWKNKGYTLINVGGLAIGLASCMLLLLYVAYEWSYDKHTTGYDRTYVVYTNMKSGDGAVSYAWTSGIMAPYLSSTMPDIAYASHSTYPREYLLSNQDKSFKKFGVYADPSFLKIFDYQMIKGNKDQALKSPNGIILTERFAKVLFGNADPMNKTLKFGGKELLTVEGVMEDVPSSSSIQFDYLMSWELYKKINPWVAGTGWGNGHCLTVIQLRDNSSFEKVNASMNTIFKRNDKGSTAVALIHPLSKWHLYSHFENGKSVGGQIDTLRIFFILAFCILLIACINFMNLSTARSEKRAKEVGVRKAIGAARKSLISQFILESMLLAFLGMIVAFILIEISLPYFNGLLNSYLTLNYADWKFWAVLVGLTLFTGFIAGSYPAFYLSSFEPVKVLKGFSKTGGASLSIRKVLVIFQFVFASSLIICTAVIYQQLTFIQNKPVGYDRNGLVEIPLEGVLEDFSKATLLRDRLLKSGAVSNASLFSLSLTSGGNNTTTVGWPGKGPNESFIFNYRYANSDFVATLGSTMQSGRNFSPQFNDSANTVINEAAVKVMGLKKPVGSVIQIDDRQLTIIGVMKNFVMDNPYQTATPLIIRNGFAGEGVLAMRLNPAQNISTSIAQVQSIMKEINPEYPTSVTFLSDSFEAKFNSEKLLGTLANWFGGFAVFISCLGLLGLTLFMAEQRKKEISIRKVLGANTLHILTLLNKDFIKLVVIANLIAFPVAYIVINKWLSKYEFRVEISFIPFAIAIVLSLLIALFTVSMQSVKVAKANPVDALKYE
ncbi:ABC transporter permease [Pedobacter gandavensis]|uniref:FtsX-like permease family protein n=1 Tax=Pedobacter gandavensis TaxID=2679963 RepID=A0ABR6EVJ8_9SPHI|nr:ABC transporter permease [Pedobacter gandavensis]MBB2149216.1 FtsX-like permease family protein [Pedobacter gandavensis]